MSWPQQVTQRPGYLASSTPGGTPPWPPAGLEAAIRRPRQLVLVNAWLWVLFVPFMVSLILLTEQIPPGDPELQVGIWLLGGALAVLVNLAGVAFLAVAVHRLGGSGTRVVLGGAIQAVAVAGGSGFAGYQLLRQAYDQIDSADTVLAGAMGAVGCLYLLGQVITAMPLRVLTRRLMIWYGVAPLFAAPYLALVVLDAADRYDPEGGPLLIVPLVIGLLAFFVAMPVIWFRLGAAVRRQARGSGVTSRGPRTVGNAAGRQSP